MPDALDVCVPPSMFSVTERADPAENVLSIYCTVYRGMAYAQSTRVWITIHIMCSFACSSRVRLQYTQVQVVCVRDIIRTAQTAHTRLTLTLRTALQ